jgi:hypothetical protein
MDFATLNLIDRYDMGLHNCLTYLANSGMGIGKNDEDLAGDRDWVQGARIWLVVSCFHTNIAPEADVDSCTR